MTIVFRVGDEFPESCEECPLFSNDLLGSPATCIVGGEYTDEEVESEEEGELNLYYHGCLSIRPKNCPLEEMTGGDET